MADKAEQNTVVEGAGDAAGTAGSVEGATMSREMRYYYLNREKKIAKDLARYHSRPDVIAKKEERERRRAEKEAEKLAKKEASKEAKRLEKERIRQEKIALAESIKSSLKEKNSYELAESIKRALKDKTS